MLAPLALFPVCCRYDPVNPIEPGDTVIEEDRELLEDYYGLEEDINLNALTPWLLRLILDDRLTVDKKLGMAQIGDKLKDEFDVSGCVCVCVLRVLQRTGVVFAGCELSIEHYVKGMVSIHLTTCCTHHAELLCCVVRLGFLTKSGKSLSNVCPSIRP